MRTPALPASGHLSGGQGAGLACCRSMACWRGRRCLASARLLPLILGRRELSLLFSSADALLLLLLRCWDMRAQRREGCLLRNQAAQLQQQVICSPGSYRAGVVLHG